MNNFTKSVVYSGLVVAAGLVAIFAIYNNMETGGPDLSAIEPAAGQYDEMNTNTEGMTGTFQQVTDEAAQAGEEVMDAAKDAAKDAGEAMDKAVDAAVDAVDGENAEVPADAEGAADAAAEHGQAH